MPMNLISDVRSAASALKMLARKKTIRLSVSEPAFPLTSRPNQCVMESKRSSLSEGSVDYGGLVFHYRTEESLHGSSAVNLPRCKTLACVPGIFEKVIFFLSFP